MKLRFFSNAEYKSSDYKAPKWVFHVEEVCGECEVHLRFMPQTKDLIESLNGRLLLENTKEGHDKFLAKNINWW